MDNLPPEIEALESEDRDPAHMELHLMPPEDGVHMLIYVSGGTVVDVAETTARDLPSAITKMLTRASIRASIEKFSRGRRGYRR